MLHAVIERLLYRAVYLNAWLLNPRISTSIYSGSPSSWRRRAKIGLTILATASAVVNNTPVDMSIIQTDSNICMGITKTAYPHSKQSFRAS